MQTNEVITTHFLFTSATLKGWPQMMSVDGFTYSLTGSPFQDLRNHLKVGLTQT